MYHHSIAEKIGQLFLIGFEGATLSQDHPIARDIIDRNLGGVILFDKLLAKNLTTNNIVTPAQVTSLTSSLQDLAGGNLLIAVDQEGGMVTRIKKQHGFPPTPEAEVLGRATDSEETSRCSRQVARMLASLGINFNMAPVVDLNIYPQNPIIGAYGRSFSNNPDIVFKNALKWIVSHRREGILSCLKHFPGHGSSRNDSHLGFVDISATWHKTELQPYKDLIIEGYHEAIMVGHLFNSHFDKLYPATLSYDTVHKILRSQLHYKGLIVSDDMQMGAITDHYGLGKACCKAISAGVDVLIIGNNIRHDPYIFKKLQTEMLKAVDMGKLTTNRIEEAWSRVQKFKLLRKNLKWKERKHNHTLLS